MRFEISNLKFLSAIRQVPIVHNEDKTTKTSRNEENKIPVNFLVYRIIFYKYNCMYNNEQETDNPQTHRSELLQKKWKLLN